ncbi:calcium-binding protein [Bauldia sp.]|uniref:calcium-binding protein n=1 Tax=Bauldia sp. TaxID=2575872 RepID=UPI003BAC2750
MATINGTAASETIKGTDKVDFIYGKQGNDILKGKKGADSLFGDEDNDTLIGGRGADYLNGGSGIDTASYKDSHAGVEADLSFGAGKGGTAKGDTWVEIENLTGSDFNDKLTGDDGVNVLKGGKGKDKLKGKDGGDFLIGGKGNDNLKGGAGFDELSGNLGNDTMTGGSGVDRFIFDTKLDADTNVDKIKDFTPNVDKIVVDNDIFKKLGASVDNNEFRMGKKAKDDDDHLLYHQQTGNLFYDKNGDDPGGKTLFAKLDKGLTLSAFDFEIT